MDIDESDSEKFVIRDSDDALGNAGARVAGLGNFNVN